MKYIKQLSVIVIILVFITGCVVQKQEDLEIEKEITSWESSLDIEMIDSEKEGKYRK